MLIGIRKEISGYYVIYKELDIGIDYSKEPYEYKVIEIEDKFKDCSIIDFNEDLTFNIEKYNSRKQLEKQNDYADKIVAEIRKKYNLNQELAILRQRDTKPEEFKIYNEYVEQCKAKVKSNL